MKTSDSGRAKSTTGSSSGQKACGGRGFSLPEVAKTAADAMASCSPPWKSLDTGCYLFQEWNSTWYNARRECKQSGGYLLEVDSWEEQDAIMDEISDRGWDGYNHFGIETVTVGIPISVYQRPRITNLVLWILKLHMHVFLLEN